MPKTVNLRKVDWPDICDTIYQVLIKIKANPERFKGTVADANLEQITAMALTQIVKDELKKYAKD